VVAGILGRVRLLTWNLNGLDEDHIDDRMEAAVFTAILGARLDQLEAGAVGSLPPDVMVFQEVTTRTFQSQLAKHLPAGGYQIRPSQALDRETFEVVAYRQPLTLHAYDVQPLVGSQYSRFLHVADFVEVDGRQIRICTGHFDSGTDTTKIRNAQLRQVNGVLSESERGVFAGDANLRKSEWADIRDRLAMRDAFEVLGEPPECKVTWRRDEYKARFDRVFITSVINPTSMHTYGIDPLLNSKVLISDHLGLLVELD
jgi:endonuclease/exonuclease/phosphatase family metal-dependent hydrolase